MCFNWFKKKEKPAEKSKADHDTIEVAANLMGTLIVQAEDGEEEIVEDLKKLQEKIRYMTSSRDEKVMNYDKKIQNKINDFKVVMLKKSGVERKKAVDEFIRDVSILIEERNAYWK